MAERELWRGRVERLGWGGQGIARAQDGRLILLDAPQALIPGEEVEAEVGWKARHGTGRVTRWLATDPRRPGGPLAPAHPGYPLHGLPRTLADELKQQIATDLLHRMLPDAGAWTWLAAPEDARRSRIQLHWDGALLGPHAAKTNQVVELEHDPLAAPALSAALPILRDLLHSGSLPAAPARWELATGTPDGDVRTSCGDATWRVAGCTPDSSPLLHQLDGVMLQQHPRAFFQACPAWAWTAFSRVLRGWELSGAKLFDLYGGGGFFSRLLAGHFERYVVVESSPLSVADARVNLAGMNAAIRETDVARGLAAQPKGWAGVDDTLLLDPPRAGLPLDVAARVRDCAAGQMVLVGCDGAAFARDIRRITDGGRWRLERLAVIDLFPFTPEVECVGLLSRRLDA